MILALALLGPAFNYIPSTALAAIIIAAVIPVVDVLIVWKIFKLKCELQMSYSCVRTPVIMHWVDSNISDIASKFLYQYVRMKL